MSSDVPPRAPDLRPRASVAPEFMWNRLEQHRGSMTPEVLAKAEELAAMITAAIGTGDASQLLQLSTEFDELVPR